MGRWGRETSTSARSVIATLEPLGFVQSPQLLETERTHAGNLERGVTLPRPPFRDTPRAMPISELDRAVWATRFKAYTDAQLLAHWRKAAEEPDEVDEIALEEIRRRNLDF